jgi:nitrate reductase alpha subunit
MSSVTRRQVLIAGAAGSLALSLRGLVRAQTSAASAAPAAATASPPLYGSYQDLYRQRWQWDRVGRGTHVRANCFSACAFDLYVKDGIVWREEQADVYGRASTDLPDYAPRGCQKGACYSSLMTSPDRITHPLERVGPRGSGRWRRISWEKALTRVADEILDAIEEGGPETVVYDNGTSNVDSGPSSLGEMRLFTLLGGTMLDGFGGTGDLALGAFQTWGTSFVDGSSDDWTRADTLIFWHCNPMATRIPDAHFATEARYRGTTLITIAPDLSPSAIHASLQEEGSDQVFYVFDEAGGAIAETPGSMGQGSDSLDLAGVVPALAGSFEAETLQGRVRVRPVMERLRERLEAYTPEHVRELTGIGVGTQERLLEILATSKRTLIYATWGSNRGYHSDLLHRGMILISALRGQQGRTGSGVRFAAWLGFDGQGDLSAAPPPPWWQQILMRFYTPPPRVYENGLAGVSPYMPWMPSHLLLYLHGGLDRYQDADAQDASLPRPARAYLDESMQKGWIPVRLPRDKPPRVFVTSGVNPLRRWPLPQVVEQNLWPKLRLIVALDFRVSSTGMKADLLLPAASHYEKRGIKYLVALAPYVVASDRAMEPLGESKGEWEITWRLAHRIQERARERGVESLADFHDRFSVAGRYGPDDDETIVDMILRESSVTKGVGWKEALERGAVRVSTIGGWGTTSGIGSEIEPDGPITPSRIHLEGKHAWPTLTGRQQFYLDHPWFEEADEVLPRFKPLPRAGGDHPILLTGGHTRWSIHAFFRGQTDLLRLQRGEPAMWMAVEDARERGIRDHDRVRVWNDHGEFWVRARPAASVKPGEAILYHAWEPYQYPRWKSFMDVVSSPYKPTHFAGGYGHLRYRLFHAGPVHVPRGIPVEIEPAAAGV